MTKNINRFKFSTIFLDKIKIFCKENHYLDDNDFKKQFDKWKISNLSNLNEERTYLESIGYEGNFIQKLDKSINHYFKKNFQKIDVNVDSNVNVDLNTTFIKILKIRDYLILDFDFLQLIDNHINRHISENTKIKPSVLFQEFKLIYINEINEQIQKLNIVLENIEKCNNKIKKTYQNRYYNINKNL
jgi:hypothetical protein